MVGVTALHQPNRQQQAVPRSVPAPIGGVNARDALAEMPATDAVVMDNWFCQPSYISVRNGCQLWCSTPAALETAMAYNGTSTRNIFGFSNKVLYNLTTAGAPSTVNYQSGSASTSRFQHAMFNSGSGGVLCAVSGGDTPLRYDGNTSQGGVFSYTSLVPGAAYTNGTYTNQSLTGGTGSGAKATIVVAGNVVTSVTITTVGTGYYVGDVLSAAIPGGAGFSITVQTLTGWSQMAISGVNSITGATLNVASLITVTVHQNRCWYIENNSMNVWYTASQAFQGTLTMFPVGQIFKMGGYLMQMASWAIDNVEGINSYAAFITSEGEVAIFQGYDPAQQSTWSMVGTFRMGRPIGRRCIATFGSDVLCITADGLTPLSRALLTDRTQAESNMTYKILNAINADVQSYASNFGWQVIEHPIGNKLIINVPEVTDSTSHQWVKNTIRQDDGGWSRFRNWNAMCWEVQQDSLYFGGTNGLYLADTGYSDAGSPITLDCLPAFSYMDLPGELKAFHLARPIFQSSANVQPVVTLNVDYTNVIPTSIPLLIGGTAPWDTSPWDFTPWGDISVSITVKNWLGVTGEGYAASGRVTMQTEGIACQWYSTDYLFERGGPL